MNKKLLMVATGVVVLLGGAAGAYLLYDHNEHEPLILSCSLTESAAGPSQSGLRFIARFEAPPAGWSAGPANHAPEYWNFEKEKWDGGDLGASFEADEAIFAWTEVGDDYSTRSEINRKTGEYSKIRAKGIPFTSSGGRKFLPDAVVVERGVCSKSVEPTKGSKKQLF